MATHATSRTTANSGACETLPRRGHSPLGPKSAFGRASAPSSDSDEARM